MKRIIAIAGAALLIACGALQAKQPRKARANASFTISTAELCRDVKGYRGPVPVSVTFTDGKISGIKLLPNHETPSYFQRVERSGIVQQFIGLTPAQAEAKKVDAVSGATFSSRALIRNIQTAAREARKRK